MRELTRLKKQEEACRRRAQSEPDKKWYWLAQAAKYQIQANLEAAENPAEPSAPEVQLASWPLGEDQRRLQ